MAAHAMLQQLCGHNVRWNEVSDVDYKKYTLYICTVGYFVKKICLHAKFWSGAFKRAGSRSMETGLLCAVY